MINWPKELISDIARRRSVIFLGAGISRNSENEKGIHPKTWAEFLDFAVDSIQPRKHVRSLLRKEDYLTACEVIRERLGREDFKDLLIKQFLSPKFRHAPIHVAIFKLDSRIVATPNYDKIYETYANGEAKSSIRIKHHFDNDIAEAIRRTDRIILKIHGTIDTPDKMVFTRKDYAEARVKYRSFYSALEALALTHTFLFLGCGVNDPDVRLLLEDSFFKNPINRSHIFVLPKGSVHGDVVKVIEATMNLNVLTYRKTNDHAELLSSVEYLVQLVEQERDVLRRDSNW